MKGYFSFILVFLLSLLLLSSIELYQSKNSFSLSKAIISERTYSVGTNVHHSIYRSLIDGANNGFDSYDSTHSLALCNHCPDYYCNPTISSPNYCDATLCNLCFRDQEAKERSNEGALESLSQLRQIPFDNDFNVSFNQPQLEVFLKPENNSRNGVKISYIRTVSPIFLNISSSKFSINASKNVDSGWLIYG